MDLSNINWLAVLVATVVSFVIGFLWYGPLFGKPWQRLVGLTDEEMQNANMGKIFGTAFVLTLIGAVLLDAVMPERAGLAGGLQYGLLIGAGFVATSMGVNALFSRASLGLWGIDAGYMVAVYLVMGGIIGAWS